MRNTRLSATMRARARLSCSSALVLVLVLVLAADPGIADPSAGFAVNVPAGPNTETVYSRPGGSFETLGFSISTGQRTIAGAPAPANPERQSDVDAAAASIDIRYDGLDTRRLLNVVTTDLRAAYRAGAPVRFATSSNYPAFIQRAEIRIYDLERRVAAPVATIPVGANDNATWQMPLGGSGRYAYALRVYDAKGRYDETVPLQITRTERRLDTHAQVGPAPVAPGEGEDRTARRAIPVRGGLVTISGGGGAPGGMARVMGESVPVDGSGRFVVSRILAAGEHVISVEVGGRKVVRDVNIPRSETFLIGLADVTAGLRFDDSVRAASRYTDGRLAFYLKRRTQSGYTITASADTGEGPIRDIFARLNDKDPRRVLDRLRADGTELYPTYGDASSYFDDTPTAGRAYLRVESDTLRLTWGDFKAGVTGAGLLQNTRDLYGAELRYRSAGVTAQGEPRLRVNAYAATPDTLSQRDILRGTGGSVYFLSRQDITAGSTTLTVKVVDPATGRIVSSRTLSEGADYTVDHIQGVVMLRQPLSAASAGGGLNTGSGSTYDVNLVAQFEYTPNSMSVNDTAYGGRIEAWAGDRLRFGATLMRERTAGGTQDMQGADLRYRIGDNSYAELELARSAGPGITRSSATDGGLTILSSAGVASTGAKALRFAGRFDLADLGVNREGFVDLYAEKKQAGFSTLTEDITSDQTLAGGSFEVALSQRLTFAGEAERFAKATGDKSDSGEVRLGYQLNDAWTLDGGLIFADKTSVGTPSETGNRTDAALRISYARSEDLTLYAFGQGTLTRTGGLARNDRLGLGFDARLSEKLALAGEVSGGTAGTGGNLRLSYSATPDNEIYLGYTLDPTRAGAGGALNDRGRLVFGGRRQVSQTVSTYGEIVYDLPRQQRSLSNVFGVNYTPSAAWTLSGTVEKGIVRDSASGDFDRLALSFGAAYSPNQDRNWRARLEYRTEDGAGTARDRDTWALSAGYTNKVNADWRFLADVDALFSSSALGDFRDGEYVRASLGYAYRPVDNERFNMLMRYTFLQDLPGQGQVGIDGTMNQPLQKGSIFSLNASYDLSPRLTLGGKLGYRMSQVAPRGTTAFTSNTAALAALRLNLHVTHKWDVMGEGRMLFTQETGTTQTGAALAAYRHLNDNVKLGVGMEWGAVANDPAIINYQSGGLFLNFVAKY